VDVTEEREKVRSNGKKSGAILFVLLFIAIVFTAFTAYLKSIDANINLNNIKNLFNSTIQKGVVEEELKLREIRYEAKDRPNFIVYKDLIIKSTLHGITAIDKKGNEKWSFPIKMNKPLLKTKGLNLVAADVGGTMVLAIDQKGVKWEETLEGDIINADISKKGFITVIHEVEGYKGIVRVFDPEGQEVFKRYIIDTFVFSGEVLPSGESVIINSIDISGIGATSCIEFTNLLGNPFAALLPRENLMYPFVFTLEDDSFSIANDTSIICFDRNRNEVWEKKYKKVYSIDVIDDKLFIAAVSSNDTANTSEILFITREGKVLKSYPLKREVNNISTYRDIVAINTGREVYFINSKADLILKYNSLSDVLQVYFFSKDEAAIVTRNSVDIIKIQRGRDNELE
jgi:hypothetical protein